MGGFMQQTMRRWQGALTTLPSVRDAIECVLAIILFGMFAWWIGGSQAWIGEPVRLGLVALLLPFLAPSFFEEMIFRAALLPRAEEMPIAPWGPAIFALILFTAAHPLNAWLFLPAARGLFTDPMFLFTAAMLGAVATVLYLRSQTIWTPIIFHGAIVAGWKLAGAPRYLFADLS